MNDKLKARLISAGIFLVVLALAVLVSVLGWWLYVYAAVLSIALLAAVGTAIVVSFESTTKAVESWMLRWHEKRDR